MAENGPFGTPLSPQIPPKSLCGSLFCILSQETRHIIFLLEAQMGVLGGGQKVYVEKVYVLPFRLLGYTMFCGYQGKYLKELV